MVSQKANAIVSGYNMKMPGFQQKVTHHTIDQEDLKLIFKRQSIDRKTKMTETLEYSEKDFKEATD